MSSLDHVIKLFPKGVDLTGKGPIGLTMTGKGDGFVPYIKKVKCFISAKISNRLQAKL